MDDNKWLLLLSSFFLFVSYIAKSLEALLFFGFLFIALVISLAAIGIKKEIKRSSNRCENDKESDQE